MADGSLRAPWEDKHAAHGEPRTVAAGHSVTDRGEMLMAAVTRSTHSARRLCIARLFIKWLVQVMASWGCSD